MLFMFIILQTWSYIVKEHQKSKVKIFKYYICLAHYYGELYI